MSSPLTAPYGHWASPFTVEMLSMPSKSNYNCDIQVNGQNIYWTESRPQEKGRTVLMEWTPEKQLQDITPPSFDIRSKVHEYGGLAYAVSDSTLYFVHSKDQRLYKIEKGANRENPTALTESGQRFADLQLTPYGLLAVRETHLADRVDNDLVLIDENSGSISLLDSGQDFYASPTISADGTKIAWLSWNHPFMPWDSTYLWAADFTEGKIANRCCIAGGLDESIFQPQWSPKGNLHFISDRTGWWNLYRYQAGQVENIFPLAAEFGLPLWRLGLSTWGFTGNNEEIFYSYQQKGEIKIGLLASQPQDISLPQTDFTQIKTGRGFAVFLMGSATSSRRVAKLDFASNKISFLDKPEQIFLSENWISVPEVIEFPTEAGQTAHGFFYPAKNSGFMGPKEQKPPLMVLSHGGPTAHVHDTLSSKIQYWTSRGFALLDVNYRGSSGYGRAYRERLKGSWGITDVQDCVQGAHYLSQRGDVDPTKWFIRGSSAGGYTTLAALTFTKAFCAGASYYGVGDLELLAKDSHKFELHYLDSLIGPYPERLDLYKARSPLHHADQISSPIIFFQGEKDKVVPPQQAISMVEALQRQGIPTQLILYPDEEHGFRQAANIRDSLEKELQFYQRILNAN